jgi:hypothetical protein
MYTNIQPDIGIAYIANWIQVPNDVLQKLLILLLGITMICNVFSFDDTHWIKKINTAMGKPCTCSYATLSYTKHEVNKILAHFREFLLLLKCFIDHMFGIWIGNEEKEWEQFKKSIIWIWAIETDTQ